MKPFQKWNNSSRAHFATETKTNTISKMVNFFESIFFFVLLIAAALLTSLVFHFNNKILWPFVGKCVRIIKLSRWRYDANQKHQLNSEFRFFFSAAAAATAPHFLFIRSSFDFYFGSRQIIKTRCSCESFRLIDETDQILIIFSSNIALGNEENVRTFI